MLLGLILTCISLSAQAGEFSFAHENVLGTSLELRMEADSFEAASRAEAKVLAEIDRLAAIFSGYDRTSEFSRWLETTRVAVKVSPELFEVLQASDELRKQTGGSFDPRVEALTRLWARSAKLGRPPTSDELATIRRVMAPTAWKLDPQARTAEHLSDCPLSLDAIAKGYIVESACKAGFDPSQGVHGLLLNLGGDLRVCGEIVQTVTVANPSSDSDGAEPLARIEVRDQAVATSSHSQRGFRIGDQWYSHIFDPQSGRPVDQVLSATVIAPRTQQADALATVFNVLPIEESLRLANNSPGVECLLVEANGRTVRSQGWPSKLKVQSSSPRADAILSATPLEQAKDPVRDQADGGKSLWNEDFELLVSFEIQGPTGSSGRYLRPFIAVWVEDKEGTSVRTLALWAQKNARSQWVPDLRRWYRGDQDRRLVDDLDLRKTLSRATRPPGKYDVLWDGKDDHGRRLAAGEYTINLEAAREHGTYQIIRQSITVADQPFAKDLNGNVEIKSAKLTYRRKNPPR